MIVSGSKGEIRCKVDPCSKCGKRVEANVMLCMKYGNQVHGRCAKSERVTSALAKASFCEGCVGTMLESVQPDERKCATT